MSPQGAYSAERLSDSNPKRLGLLCSCGYLLLAAGSPRNLKIGNGPCVLLLPFFALDLATMQGSDISASNQSHSSVSRLTTLARHER